MSKVGCEKDEDCAAGQMCDSAYNICTQKSFWHSPGGYATISAIIVVIIGIIFAIIWFVVRKKTL
jgi:Cys-rich repeat protein